MPLGRGIVEMLEAIPERIEVSGQAPTWRVTGGSFESVLAYTRAAYGEAAVIGREDRTRWWRRVTLTVTTDPQLLATAPDPHVFASPAEPAEAPDTSQDSPASPRHAESVPAQRGEQIERVAPATFDDGDRVPGDDGPFAGVLEEIFAHQEALRHQRTSFPQQRSSDA